MRNERIYFYLVINTTNPVFIAGYEMAGGMPPLSEAVFNRVVVENNVRGEVATELPFTESAVRDGVARVASRHPGGKVVINMEMDRDH